MSIPKEFLYLNRLANLTGGAETAPGVPVNAGVGSDIFHQGSVAQGAIWPKTAVVIRPVQNVDLIRLFSRIPFNDPLLPRPNDEGTYFQRAGAIRSWMKNNQDRLDEITYLDLSDSGLTTLPSEIVLFSNLHRLALSNNHIASLAGISLPASLITLDFSGNQIASLAGVALPACLTRLKLDDNQIASLAGVSFPPGLTELILWNNQLTTLSGVTLPAGLITLDLSSNRLTSLSGLSLPAGLRMLDLFENNFTSFAGICLPPGLTHLDLGDNMLRELPDSIPDLPSACVVNVENNRFSPEYVVHFQELLSRRRAEDPTRSPLVTMTISDDGLSDDDGVLPLEEQLKTWAVEFAAPSNKKACLVNYKQLLDLADSEKAMLSKYLGKLHGIADYRDPAARPQVIHRVECMLQLACENAEFRSAMFDLITEGLGSCGDRVLIVFNEIEIQWQMHREELSDEAAARLAIRTQRYELLKQHAVDVAKQHGLGDQIETILYFHIHLREKLDLPISTEGMLYPACSGVTQQMLDDACSFLGKISDRELLEKSDLWQAWMQKKHQHVVDEINERYAEILSDAEEYFRIEKEKRLEFLRGHESLAAILREYGDTITEYTSAAKKINEKRMIVIAQMGPAKL